MPIDEVNIVRSCGSCGTEIETVTAKKDNMMLSSKQLVWCPKCQAERPEVRDLAGRLAAIEKEQKSYPKAVPAKPFPRRPPVAEKETVAVLTSNLFFLPRIEAAAEAGGLEAVNASSAHKLMEIVASNNVPLVLLDLETDEPVWTAALRSLMSVVGQRPRIVAYGPHGEPGTLRKARGLGSDAVLTKRDFSEGLQELLSSRGGPAAG